MMLPLFKSKGLKAYNKDKDRDRGIAMFPVITKIFEMLFLKRLEGFREVKVTFRLFNLGLDGLLAVLRPHL